MTADKVRHYGEVTIYAAVCWDILICISAGCGGAHEAIA